MRFDCISGKPVREAADPPVGRGHDRSGSSGRDGGPAVRGPTEGGMIGTDRKGETAALWRGEAEGEGEGGPPSASIIDFQKRQSPVHLTNLDRHNKPVILFVTVCTKNRKRVLAAPSVHRILATVWAQAHQYRVGRYMIMPEHAHLFCSPAFRDSENVNLWVAYWKRLASLRLADLKPLWQRHCWDTQLRSGDSYQEKWDYVRLNPVRKGLVSDPEAWPYQGCLNELPW